MWFAWWLAPAWNRWKRSHMCHCVICVVASTCMKQMKEEPNVGRQKAATKKQYSIVQMSVYNFAVALKKGTRGPSLHGHSDCSCHRYIHCMVTVTVRVRYIHCMVTVTVRVRYIHCMVTVTVRVTGTSIAWSQWLFVSRVHPLLKTGGL